MVILLTTIIMNSNFNIVPHHGLKYLLMLYKCFIKAKQCVIVIKYCPGKVYHFVPLFMNQYH